jgi:hypothetical protein
MKGRDIINQARKELKEFISFEGKAICKLKDNCVNGMDGVWVVDGKKYLNRIKVEVEVDNSYFDVEDNTTEKRSIEELCIEGESLGGTVWLNVEGGEEVYLKSIPTDTLADIANALESAYLRMVNGK